MNSSDNTSRIKVHFRLFLLILFPAIYIFLATIFLNKIPVENLFSTAEAAKGNEGFIYFFLDIFDVFWLILAAVPNGVFAAIYFWKLFSNEDTLNSTVFSIPAKWFMLCVAICISLLVFWGIIVPTTSEFNAHENVWSHNLASLPSAIYSFFSFISVFTLVTEGVCIVCYCAKSITLTENHTKENGENQNVYKINSVSLYSLAAAIILFFYWIMLVLSNISNIKYSLGIVGQDQIIPMAYSVLGGMATLAVTVCVYLQWKWHQRAMNFCKDTYPNQDRIGVKFVVGSIVIPCIPIIIQIFQIFNN